MSYFDINGKVAIITGGASGLGFQYALELLGKGARGVTLADIASEVGQKAIKKIEDKFGKNKAIFVKVDVTNKEEFEDAFKKTLSTFNNIDILINNAGIMNDAVWEREIDINVKGTIHGILLGLHTYIPKHKSGTEGVIINISSIAGIAPFGFIPVYVGTKFAVHGMTWSWGLPCHYNRTNVKVVGVCPGMTMTPLIKELENRNLNPVYEEIRLKELDEIPPQSTDQIAPHVMTVIEKAPSSTLWVIEAGEAPYQFQVPDRFKMTKKYLE